MTNTILLENLHYIGQELGTSDWLEISQERIEAFADVTDDHQWILVDAKRAATGPYGSTVAHGYLIGPTLPRLTAEAYNASGVSSRVNYGLDKVHFPAALQAGTSIRDHATLRAVDLNAHGTRVLVRNEIEIKDNVRPTCVAETITLLVRAEGTK